MTTMKTRWAEVGREVAEIEAAPLSEYDDPTRKNLTTLLDFIRSSGRPPPRVDAGYWPTFNLSWDNAPEAENLIVEVFGDRYEIYRIYDGRTDIRHYDHVGEGALPAEVVKELPGRLVSAGHDDENG